MRSSTLLFWAASYSCLFAEAALDTAPVQHGEEVADVLRRLEPAKQPLGYTPRLQTCPARSPTIRAASGLSQAEISWLNVRRPNAIAAMETLLNGLNISGFDLTTYFNDHASNLSSLPNIGIAASGGGYRALMNGAGAFAAFDNRSNSGYLGGLLQSTTYLAGLSGSSWLIGSLFANNFTTVQDIVDGRVPVWDFTNSILEGPDQGLQILTTAAYYAALYTEVNGKQEAGFNITLTDFWGRALSFQLINADDGGPDYTFSSLRNQTFFANGSVPMPIIVADGRLPDQVIISSNATVFEFSPFELGSQLLGFSDLQYLGTNYTNGIVLPGDSCVSGVDNIGFVYGTSSTLFNSIILDFNSTGSVLENLIQFALNEIGEHNNDISDINNPFFGYLDGVNPWAATRRLTLVDGGENLENLPLQPLIQPYRNVDVIFAIDSSADTATNWPNGTSLVATYERSFNASIQNQTLFPSIPDQNTMVNLGLNQRPTFFGCNASNYSLPSSASSSSPPPLIVYLPNSPYTAYSNVSTFNLSYTDSQRNAIINNGYNVVTRGNTSLESWPTCLGCAILQRSLERTGTAVPAVCVTCYDSYCWNGTINATTPTAYEPMLGPAQTAGGSTTGTATSTATATASTASTEATSSAASVAMLSQRLPESLSLTALLAAFLTV